MWTVIYQRASGIVNAVYVLAQTPDDAILVAKSGVPDDQWDGLIAVAQGHLTNLYLDLSGDEKLWRFA